MSVHFRKNHIDTPSQTSETVFTGGVLNNNNRNERLIEHQFNSL